MATNRKKYITSAGTHYIANSGSDENGNLKGGKAGDQTGKEFRLRGWYSRPWTCVLRFPDIRVGTLLAELGIDAALAKYYTICAAALSEIPYHAAHLMSSKGYTVEQRIFDRRTSGQGAE